MTIGGTSDVLSLEMNCALGLTAALASTALLASGCGGSPHAGSLSGPGARASLPGLTAAKLARIKVLASQAAKADGDAHPSSVMVFASRRHQANIAAGAGTGVFGNQPVYLVVIRGHFVCSSCSGPAGGQLPHGDVITLVLERTKLQSLDFGIGGHVDTSSVGRGVSLRLP